MRTRPQHQPQLFKIFGSIDEQTPDDKRRKLVGALIDTVDLTAVYATYKEGIRCHLTCMPADFIAEAARLYITIPSLNSATGLL